MDESKPFYLSKTLWTNIIVGILGIFNSEEVSQSPEAAVGFLAFVNVIRRLITKGSVTIS